MTIRLIVLMVTILSGSAQAQPAAAKAFFAKHCVECHGPDLQEGDLRLDTLAGDLSKPELREKWQAVHDRLEAGTMPPAKKPRPEAKDARTISNWILEQTSTLDRARFKTEGRVALRRLNRTEYENTLRDLLGVDVEVKDLLPADAISHGFDNISESLSVSPVQMQRYLQAAELALTEAIATGPKPVALTKTYTLAEGRAATNIGKHWHKTADGSVVLFNSGTFPSTQIDSFRAPARGRYRLTLRGSAYQSKLAVPFALYYGNFGRGGDVRLQGYHEFAPGDVSAITVTLELDAGDSIQILPYGLKGFNQFKPNEPDRPATYTGPGLLLGGVEVQGPILAEWPSRGHKLLFGDLPSKPPVPDKAKGRPLPWQVTSAQPEADAKKLLPRFLSQAFRHPVTVLDAAPYLKLFQAEMKRGVTFQEAMLTAAAAALCAPDFLFFREKPGALNDYALATRLSYFLWRSMPDEELFRLAAAGTLKQPAVLRAQTERLLNHPNATRFTTDFTDAWLNLREIDFTTPDKLLYPEFDSLLQDSMVQETRLFFAEVLTRNLPSATLIASDFAMLNARLAGHYNIPGVEGIAVRRVPLPKGSLRGGVLTQGAVLKVSANGSNTSPVVRGVYVLERFLGVTPSPPPPGIPAVEPDIRGAKTVRELLDKHRSTESCAGCHRLIDPPGFALEGFDVIGGTRAKFRAMPEKRGVALKVNGEFVRYVYGQPVDASGEFTDGRKFQDFEQFRSLLLAEPETFAACLTCKLLTFATGREAAAAERPEVEKILQSSKAKSYAVRDLVLEIVQSDVFRSK